MIDISVVTAIKNEEENIEEYLQRLYCTLCKLSVSYEIIFVTDINQDRTYEVLKEKNCKDSRLKIVKLSRVYGQYTAIMAGLDHISGNTIVTMDCDLQDHPEDIEGLYKKLQEGYDIVYGIKEKKDDSLMRNVLSGLYLLVLNSLSDIKLNHNTNIFRIMSRRAVNSIRSFSEHSPSLTGISSLIGFPTTSLQVTSGTRKRGKTKYSYLSLFSLAFDTIFSFTVKPLRMISLLGTIVSCLSLIYLVVDLVRTFFFDQNVVPGWPTVISFIIFLGGVQLMSLGVIGEYVGRSYIEVKKRPLYIVEEKIGEFHV
jgi:dolichol-phosphate mannosyltransferase